MQIEVSFRDTQYAEEAFKNPSWLSMQSIKAVLGTILTIIAGISLILIIFLSSITIGFLPWGRPEIMIVVLLVVIGLIIFMVRPNVGKETKVEANLISLLRSIKSTLIDLQENDLKSITKCWNCFKDILPVDNVCAYCGKRQD